MSVAVSPAPIKQRQITAGLWSGLRKWLAFYRVAFADALAYRASAVIWLLTDTFPAIVMPLIWLASYHGRPTIGGFSPSQMVVYYLNVLFLSCVVESHIMWDIASYVKDGSINSYLTRPFSFAATTYAQNVSWRLMRSLMFIPLFCLVLGIFHRWVHWDAGQYNFGWSFWLAVILGHFVSFFLAYAMGMLAFFVIEVQSIYYAYYLPEILFNGQIAPLSFFPHAIAKFANLLPFVYTMSFPAQVFVGRIKGPALWMGLAYQVGWIVIAYAAGALLYREGLKRYASSGI